MLPSSGWRPGPSEVVQGGQKVLHLWCHSQKTCTPEPKKFFLSASYKTCRVFWHFDQVCYPYRSRDIPTQSHMRSSCFLRTAWIKPDVKVLNYFGQTTEMLWQKEKNPGIAYIELKLETPEQIVTPSFNGILYRTGVTNLFAIACHFVSYCWVIGPHNFLVILWNLLVQDCWSRLNASQAAQNSFAGRMFVTTGIDQLSRFSNCACTMKKNKKCEEINPNPPHITLKPINEQQDSVKQ